MTARFFARQSIAILTIFATFMASGSFAEAQTHLRLRIQWEGPPPSAVFQQMRDTGTREISPIRNPLIVEREFSPTPEPIMIRADNQLGRHILAFLPRYSADFYDLRLELPTSADCNTSRVRAIVAAIKTADVSRVANATLSARHLVKTRACGSTNEDRLKQAFFDGYVRLTRLGEVFAMPELDWGGYGTRASLAQRDVRQRRLISLYSKAQGFRDDREYDNLENIVGILANLYESDDWRATFASVEIDKIDLQHLEVEGLYNRTLLLRNEGDFEGAKEYSLELARIAQVPSYEVVFSKRVSGITTADAIGINRGIENRLAQIEAAPTEQCC